MTGMMMQPIRNGMRHFAMPPIEFEEGIGRHEFAEDEADDRRHEDRDLLAGRLERGVEAAIARRCDFGEIDRDAAKLDAGGEALDQPAEQHDDRRCDADGRIGRAERDHHGAERHERQRDDQALAATDTIDIGPQHDRAHGAHHGAKPEHAIGIQKCRGLVGGREEGGRDRFGIEAEQEEVELLEEIAAGGAQDGADARLDHGRLGACGFRHGRSPSRSGPVARKVSRRPAVGMMRQSVTPARHDQPENAGLH